MILLNQHEDTVYEDVFDNQDYIAVNCGTYIFENQDYVCKVELMQKDV